MRDIFFMRTNEGKQEITIYKTKFSRTAVPTVIKIYELNDTNRLKAIEFLKELESSKSK